MRICRSRRETQSVRRSHTHSGTHSAADTTCSHVRAMRVTVFHIMCVCVHGVCDLFVVIVCVFVFCVCAPCLLSVSSHSFRCALLCSLQPDLTEFFGPEDILDSKPVRHIRKKELTAQRVCTHTQHTDDERDIDNLILTPFFFFLPVCLCSLCGVIFFCFPSSSSSSSYRLFSVFPTMVLKFMVK